MLETGERYWIISEVFYSPPSDSEASPALVVDYRTARSEDETKELAEEVKRLFPHFIEEAKNANVARISIWPNTPARDRGEWGRFGVQVSFEVFKGPEGEWVCPLCEVFIRSVSGAPGPESSRSN